MVCATSKALDQPAHTRSLIRAFAGCLNTLSLLSYRLNIIWIFLASKEVAQAHLSQHLSKYHIVGNHFLRLNYMGQHVISSVNVTVKLEVVQSLLLSKKSFQGVVATYDQ